MSKAVTSIDKGEDPRIVRVGAIAALIVVLLWLGIGAIPRLLYPAAEGGFSAAGTYGDSFGYVNALFSGLAFAGVGIAIWLQHKQLLDARAALKREREDLGQQEAARRQQVFESAFFQMLSLHHEIVKAIDVPPNKSGRDSFSQLYSVFKVAVSHDHTVAAMKSRDAYLAVYEKFYGRVQSELGHYFRNLYNIVKFIHRSDMPEKSFYTNLVRAQLSSHELALLAYNCVSKYGVEKFKPLVEQYALLKNLPKDLFLEDGHRDWYEPDAFRGGELDGAPRTAGSPPHA